MIKDNARAVIQDVLGKTVLSGEVNFDEEHKDCVKFIIGDPNLLANTAEIVVKYEELFAFMFTLATPEQQAKMVPVREELGNQYMKQINVKLTKDLKAGEFLVVNVPINVPQVIEDAILEKKKLLDGGVETPYLTQDNKEL